MRYLSFDLSEDVDGYACLEAMASTTAAEHALVMAEVAQVLDWAWQRFPHTHGPLDDGLDWDHDLQVTVEGGRWQVVTLTLAGSPRFVEAFLDAFGNPPD